MCQSVFVYSDSLLDYKFNAVHPFNPLRIQLTLDLLGESGSLNEKDIVQPQIFQEDVLALIHDSSYIEAVKKASLPGADLERAKLFGLGTEDTPIFTGMHQAALNIVSGTLTCCDLVMSGKADHALNLSGGLHHGVRNSGSGFCVYNDVAIAIQYLKDNYHAKVLYIDTDAHHGDGVQWSFYDDPDVCTFSIHETGRYLFPGTGEIEERGIGKGYGFTFNLPVDAFTEDESWLDIFSKSVAELAAFFHPDILVTQHGVDGHFYDPLTHLCLSMKTYEQMPKILHRLAHRYTGGKWIAVGGGGYDHFRVVPRAWSLLWHEMSGFCRSQASLPEAFLEKWQGKTDVTMPKEWLDPVHRYPDIPRREEITRKNTLNLRKTLQPVYKFL